ncbi:hypothetical protein SISSUDRAFT_1133217 [Sistotremastrum suecicum HHB10207 ss-3]|uniref:F-box domain-containing protein n=1 Tax=Sistotremastrum suecicum HHB10207 ss-3 TaxID=1314776 RepID=A0A165XLV5_9AGAM|nr:hypothetical protein SISSUDRAFT_1133217 [Sistotremastrum suecicum HHB10207 ss-3]
MELSAQEQSLQISMAELMDVLERTLNDARQVENGSRTIHAPIFSEMSLYLNLASATLNQISNLHIPIGRLPDEVVAEILLATVSAIMGNGPLIDPCHWEHLMHVCSRWTRIIREDSRFWRSINFAWNQTTVDRYLSLCKDGSLSLQMPSSAQFLLAYKNLLLRSMWRAKEINIITSDDQSKKCTHNLWSTFNPPSPISSWSIDRLGVTEAVFSGIRSGCTAELLIASMPNLTKLMVHCSHSTAPTHSLPPLQHLSSLVTLELYDCRLEGEWNCIFPASLRHLLLAYPAYLYPTPKPGVSIVNIIGLMTHCPSLNSLDVAGAIITSVPQALQPRGTITAQQLRRLVVSDTSSAFDLLSHFVHAPLLSEVHHTVPFIDRMPPLPAHLSSCMAQASHAAIEFRFSTITYTYPGTRSALDITCKHVLSIVCEPKLHYPDEFRDVEPDWTQVVDQTIIQLAKLEHLTIELDHWHAMGLRWNTLLANMNSLVSLDLHGVIGEDFFTTLSSSNLCPRLSFLCIRTSDHMRTEKDCGPSNPTNLWEQSRSRLLTCLNKRKLKGRGVQTLAINDRWLTGWNLSRLRSCVERIESTKGRVVDADVFLVADEV